MAQVITHSTVKYSLGNGEANEVLHPVRALRANPCKVHAVAHLVVALALCAQTGVSATLTNPRSLRGDHRHHHQHHRHTLSNLHVKIPSYDDLHPLKLPKGGLENPLYDDFLHIMNNAAGKALKVHRDKPGYDKFMTELKNGADKAYKEQVEKGSYDQFLTFMKKQTEEAYHEQVELPSYDDFLVALKESVAMALNKPSPGYKDFLNTLEAGAQKAMLKRVFGELNTKTINALAASYDKNPLGGGNPFDKMKNDAKKAKEQMTGKNRKNGDSKALREELRRLKEEQQKHKASGVPAHQRTPLMQRINVLRTQLCWQRPNLWQHEKCLRFLGITCMKASTGQGICREFTKKCNEKCKTETDPHWKEDYCALGEALSDTHGGDDEAVDEGEAVDAQGGGSDADANGATNDEGDAIGSDKDIAREDEELDDELAHDNDEAVEGEGDDQVVEDGEKLAGKDQSGKNGQGGGKDGQGGGKDGQGGGKDGSGDATKDSDGDGIPDKDDAFAKDPNEWKDTDGDGVGDNSDHDIDGDGRDNAVDVFPADKKEWADSDRDGIGDNADKDKDGDGTGNDKDKFPDDPTEWKDSDSDGVGDNKDHYPFNPNCHSPTEPCHDVTKHGQPKPGSPEDPTTLDMDSQRGVPDQGYNEYLSGPPPGQLVNHENYYTWVSDWQDEWPVMAESEKQTMARICREHPANIWCVRFKDHDAHFR